MKDIKKLLTVTFIVTVFFVLTANLSLAKGLGQDIFPLSADDNTLGLWLFDENQYPHTTLTDASEYQYDLCLHESGKLTQGRFGNALKVMPGKDYAVSFAGFCGSVTIHDMRGKDGTPSGLFGPTITPTKMLNTLASGDWSWECWLKLESKPAGAVTLIDTGWAMEPGFTVNITGAGFEVSNSYAGAKAVCPSDIAKLSDGQWHHVVFTRSAASGKVEHFLDGGKQRGVKVSAIDKQQVPQATVLETRRSDTSGFTADSTDQWRREHRFNFSLGHDRNGNNDMAGMIDELRLSDVVRYKGKFALPGSFSYNYGANAPKPTGPNGLQLLFQTALPGGVVKLDGRKHVFIDEAIIDSKANIKLTCNSPFDRKILNFGPEKSSWRASVMDVGGKVYMYIPDGYGSAEGLTRLRISENGVNFALPKLGAVEYKGSKDNEFVFEGMPYYGSFFEDLNPDVHPAARFKMTGWIANRGIYVYMSPDGVHWRRNETCMLPLVSGGGAETYWDDQRGVYVDFIKRDASFKTKECPGGGRRASMFEAEQILKAWPFKAMNTPYYEGWPMPAVTCEGPVIFANNENGQVYRTRAIKYPWAPDVYLAFVWRYQKDDQRRQVDLGVSRDGINWKFFADVKKWYVEPDKWEEVLSLYGLIRRGDEIWQYYDYGGAHGGGQERTYARFTQRLDGFVSIDAAQEPGTIVTRPVIFEGSKLVLNIDAKGYAKVALLDQAGKPVNGFDIADCDMVKADSVRQVVTWKGSSDVSKLTGSTVRVKFELQDARLFAFQFTK